MTHGPVTIDLRENLSPEAFRREYYEPHRPVILRGACKDWEALGRMSPEFVRERWGHIRLSFGEGEFSVSEILDRLEASDPARPAPYPCKLNIDRQIPELFPFISPFPLPHSEPNFVTEKALMAHRFGSKNELFLGGPGGEFPYIHYDYFHLNAWITMLYGEKEFTVYTAPRLECLYPVPGDEWRSGVENAFNPDFTKYPLFKEVVQTKVVLKAGDTLFIPKGTWHSAKSLSVSISVAFDQLGRRNMPAWIRDVVQDRVKRKPLRAAALGAY
ncbi:MAG: cupin-like domain-containing protein, partial [Myxococcales bacterium]|nr:cupin-like domain-containing protein [Myxococcales bacterium]